MKKPSKNILLLMSIFIFSSQGSAEIIGGYDRQRLLLQFQSILVRYYQAHPVTVNLQALPLEIDDQSDSDARRLYDVLTEEGYLQREIAVRGFEGDESIVSRVFRYQVRENRMSDAIVMGVVQVTSLEQWQSRIEPDSDHTEYEVSFRWLLTEPAPWLWAPSLQTNAYLTSLIQTIETPATGTARFRWMNEHWQLVESSAFVKPDVD